MMEFFILTLAFSCEWMMTFMEEETMSPTLSTCQTVNVASGAISAVINSSKVCKNDWPILTTLVVKIWPENC